MLKRSIGGYLRLAPVLAILVLRPFDASAQVPAEAEARLRAIFEGGEFNARSFRANWLRGGSGYTVLERSPGATARELVRYDAASGERTVLASLSQLVPTGETEPLGIESYTESPDGSRWLLRTNTGDYWMFAGASGALRRVEVGSGNTFSPDGGRILYARRGDLHVYDLGSDRVIPLTRDGGAASVSNGRAVWSPNGARIAYVQSDASAVRTRSMLVPSDPSYPEVREVRFARVGETITTLRVGVVDADGSEMRWLSIPSPAEGFYLGQISWAGNSHELLVERFSRFRDERDFFIADVLTGEVSRIYHETDPAWVIASYQTNAGLEWIRDGSAFVLLSEKDGWRHSYVVSRDGEEEALLTPGASDVMGRGMVDEAERWFYYFASPDNATQRYLYRVRLDGTGAVERVTPAEQPGTHAYDFAPGGEWAFHTYSTIDTPPGDRAPATAAAPRGPGARRQQGTPGQSRAVHRSPD